jgi:hypothetical protein
MFRVSHQSDRISDADATQGTREIVRGQAPGRYDVDDIRAEPFLSGHTSELRGV